METILQGLLELAGVNAAMVFDSSGKLAAERGRAIYDRALCEQVGPALTRAVDSVQLQHPEWESVQAQFADGKLLLRNLGTVAGQGWVLALVADSSLNASFATVAIRVAAGKLKKAIENPGARAASSVGASSQAHPAPAAAGAPAAAQSQPGDARPASTGVSWSKSSSSVALSGVTAADPAAGAFLSRCTKELARAVGPMAKVFVQEAVRRVSPDGTFVLDQGARLVDELSGQIESSAARTAFVQALKKV